MQDKKKHQPSCQIESGGRKTEIKNAHDLKLLWPIFFVIRILLA